MSVVSLGGVLRYIENIDPEDATDYFGKYNIGYGFESQTIVPNVVLANKAKNTLLVDLPGMYDERNLESDNSDPEVVGKPHYQIFTTFNIWFCLVK